MKKLLLLLLLLPITVKAESNTILMLDKESYQVGDTVKVTLKYTSDEVVSANLSVKSDNDVVEIDSTEKTYEGNSTYTITKIGKVKKSGKVILSGSVTNVKNSNGVELSNGVASIPLEVKGESTEEKTSKIITEQHNKIKTLEDKNKSLEKQLKELEKQPPKEVIKEDKNLLYILYALIGTNILTVILLIILFILRFKKKEEIILEEEVLDTLGVPEFIKRRTSES